MDKFKCRVCGNTVNNSTLVAREMMFGLREQFLYFRCSECGCLQIAEPLDNMQKYYPADKYYSLSGLPSTPSVKSILGLFVRKQVLALGFRNRNHFKNKLIEKLLRNKEYKWITELVDLNFSSSILDVGSGTGTLLLELNKLGFNNLTGIDPFVEKEIHHSDRLRILKGNITDLSKKQYDLIMLNHVFEHLNTPHEVFEQLRELLTPNGKLLIRIPVSDCYCWRKYGIFWFQLDAPRHFFLHTVKSMSMLAENHHLDMISVEYDSNESQFYNSEKYLRNIPLSEHVPIKPRLLGQWKKHARNLNSINDGDQACFIFSKKTLA